jgi:hypothetical protein
MLTLSGAAVRPISTSGEKAAPVSVGLGVAAAPAEIPCAPVADPEVENPVVAAPHAATTEAASPAPERRKKLRRLIAVISFLVWWLEGEIEN